MCLDGLLLAVEGDVSIVSVAAELNQLGQKVGAHVMCILGSEMLFQHEQGQQPHLSDSKSVKEGH